MRSSSMISELGESNMAGVLIKKGNLDMEMHTGWMPREHEDRDWVDVSARHGTPEIASKAPATGREVRNGFSLTASGVSNPANTWCWTSGLHICGTINFCCLSHSVCYGNPSKPVPPRSIESGTLRVGPRYQEILMHTQVWELPLQTVSSH